MTVEKDSVVASHINNVDPQATARLARFHAPGQRGLDTMVTCPREELL